MNTLIDTTSNWISDVTGFRMPQVSAIDVIEILLIAYFFYRLLVWIKDTRAWMLFRGILIVVIFFGIAALLGMSTILWLGEKLLSAGIIALVVVFQPELRSALEQLGRSNLWTVLENLKIVKHPDQRFSDKTLNDLVKASYEMGRVKTGALIVVEKDVQLTEYIRTGIMLDSILSRQLLINIFEKNTPLHDGAVIVRGDRVVAATCYLPLSDNLELSKDLGTRHRAGVGISEVSDALVIIVSEETGMVSIAQEGKLRHAVSADELENSLREMQKYADPESEKGKEKPAKSRRHARKEADK